ncbi:MAG: nitroreductase family deazaflavin-dependent oxidoreductase [Myxococcales bacterium]|nr:MAG: nitroreductase family deazaflavin-dependent oxidoreductase [Myxococcales bacterium]
MSQPRTPNLFTPLAILIGGISWMPKLLPQITAFDKWIQRVTRGTWTLLRFAGLPNLMLTVVGRKSGQPRSTPLLCVPFKAGQLIAGSNFGGAKPPVWVVNVRAADRVDVRVNGVTRPAVPHELSGAEREEAWQHMLRTWPNYAKYAERTDRVIPVFYLEPAA